MRGRLGFLLRDSVLYGAASAISKAFSLITFPILARHLSVIEYGVLDYFLVLTSLLTIFFVFGQDSAVARFFYEYNDVENRKQLISQSLIFQLTGLALLLPLFWLFANGISLRLVKTPDSVFLFRIVLLHMPFLVVINFSQNLLKWTFSRARFLTMSLGSALMQSIFLVVAVLVFDVGIAGVLVFSLATSALFGAIGLTFIRHWFILPTDLRHLRTMLPFAIPIGVICVIGAFSPAMERLLTLSLLGAEQLGLYAAGAKLAMLIGLLASAFQTAWGPFWLSLYKQADAGLTFNWVFKSFALGVCVAALSLTLVAQPLIHLLATDRYSSATIVVFPLAMGLAIQAISWVTEIGIGISKRSYLNLFSYTAAITFTLGGIWFLTPIFGLLGVSLGVLVGQIAKALVASWLAQRAYRLPWCYGPVILVTSLTLVLGLFSIWLGEEFGVMARSAAIVASLAIVVFVGWSLLLVNTERQRLIELVRIRLPSFYGNPR
jgi:O-antigen/teichoic acid export membrane protein